MTKLLLALSFKLEVSTKYKSTKSFVYNLLDNNSYIYKKYFDFFMIFLVLSTIGILIFEVNHKQIGYFDYYETFAIIIFILEYLGRLWLSSNTHEIIIEDYENSQILDKKYNILASLKKILKIKLAYILSPIALIDLLAILPYYRPLRILRIFLVFRLLKILRYTNSLKQFSGVFVERKFELFTLAILYVIVVFFGSTIMFIYEGQEGINAQVNGFFDAIYWSIITISTVGYGDVTPITVEGKLVTLVLIISGFLVIAFGTSIITTGLSDRMKLIKEERLEAEASKMKDFSIVCGYGKMGQSLCEELAKIGKKFIIIDICEENIEYSKSKNYLSIKADATNIDLLENIGVNKGAKDVIALCNDDAVNISIILSARTLNPNINIIARVNKENSSDKFKIAGANSIILANQISAYVSANHLGQAVAFEAIDEILLNNDTGANLDEIEVLEGSDIINKDVKYIDFSKYNLTLLGIINANKKSDFIFNPLYSNYIIKEKDILIVIGYKIAISQLKSDLINNSFGEIDV